MYVGSVWHERGRNDNKSELRDRLMYQQRVMVINITTGNSVKPTNFEQKIIKGILPYTVVIGDLRTYNIVTYGKYELSVKTIYILSTRCGKRNLYNFYNEVTENRILF